MPNEKETWLVLEGVRGSDWILPGAWWETRAKHGSDSIDDVTKTLLIWLWLGREDNYHNGQKICCIDFWSEQIVEN